MPINAASAFGYTLLAEACYAKPESYNNVLDNALKGSEVGFSQSQLDRFNTEWEVVPGSYQPSTGNGFSATLYKNRLTGEVAT